MGERLLKTAVLSATLGIALIAFSGMSLASDDFAGGCKRKEQAIETYLRSVRQGWDTNVSANNVSYAADVYVARVTAAIVGVAGVVNATNVQLNGGTADLLLTETGETQQVPVIGTVKLNESN